MLSLRSLLFSKLGYRSCSSFSSVLTIGKQSQPSDDKGHQPDDHHPRKSQPNTDPKEDNNQFYPVQYASRANKGDGEVVDATHGDVEESVYGSDEFYPKKPYRKNNKFSRSGTGGETDSFADGRDRGPRHFKNKFGDGDWRSQDIENKFGKNKWKQQKPGKYGRSKWDEQNSDEWDQRDTSWRKPGNRWDTNNNQWHDIPKPYGKSSEHHNRWDAAPAPRGHEPSRAQDPDRPRDGPQRWTAHQDQANPPSRNTPAWSRDKPRGKRLRKKDKLGFIESEAAPSHPEAEHILYGLHPVSLALSAGRREVRRVYHRADAGGRLSRLLAECAARGIGLVPLPTTQLDRIAGGTGVHQGVCVRVTPLRPRPVDELLATVGCPPLEAAAEQQGGVSGSEEAVRSTDADTSRGEDQSGTSGKDGAGPTRAELRVQAGAVENPLTWTEDGSREPGASDEAARPGQQRAHRRRVWLLLDRVQDPMNFGSILRSSYFLGVDAVIIPDKNSCPLSPTVSKASAGVLEVFPTYSVPADSCVQLLQRLQSRRWQLLAAGSGADGGGGPAEPPGPVCPDTDTLLVVGNEGRGVEPALASLCRQLTVPPQRQLVDGVESLNVGVATGILLSQLTLGR